MSEPLSDEEFAALKASLLSGQDSLEATDRRAARDLQRFFLGCALTIGLGLLFIGLCLAAVVAAFRAVL